MSATADFNRYAGDFGGHNFTILFVKAGFDDVVDVYARDIGASAQSNVTPVELNGQQQMPPVGVVVSVKGCDWCIVFHRVGQFDNYDPTEISSRLQCDVIAFKAEDTSGLTGCERYAPNGAVVRYFEPEDKETDESLAECCGIEPGPAELVSSYGEFFDANGIQVVELCCGSDRSVAASQADLAMIDRVALVGECPWDA